MLHSLLRWPCLLQDVLNRRLLFKANPRRSDGEQHPSFLRFWNWARKLSCSQKFVAAQKMLLNRNPANIRKWIAQFYYFRHLYSAGSACTLLTIIAWVAHRYGQLYLHCSLIYFLGSFQLFLHSDQPLSEGEIIPIRRCLPVGGKHIIHARGEVARTLTDRLLWCATDDDRRQHHHAEHHFQL